LKKPIDRRAAVGGLAVLPLLGAGAFAADKPLLGTPPSVITNPPRMWGKDAPPDVFPDPDVITVDPAFGRLIVRYAPITRLGTGYQWAEGPAWSGEGQYLLFSDVQGNTQYRLIWETGDIVPFRKPSFYSNGNCFDFQGRQLSCQHYFRRVVRWELDGAMTVVADSFEGKSLNAPNDICFSPDYKRVYIISGGIHVGDVVNGKVENLRDFTDCMVDGIYCHPDGMRADRAGNIWASSNTVLGYSGVTVWNPQGKLLGRLRLPEGAANVCFGGPKRDHLFITASQSLYALKLNIQGAAPG
jgi:sugar lactone lactonase YvrE